MVALIFVGLAIGDSNGQPLSYQLFCMTNPLECKLSGSTQIELNDQSLHTIKAINNRVNQSIISRLDPPHNQRWRINPPSGDCKSYVVTKRYQLAAAGFPRNSMTIYVVELKDRTLHAVLSINTDSGEIILDNLISSPYHIDEIKYKIIDKWK